MHDNLNFLKLWLKRPASLGAVLPSSRSLAAAMACEIDAEAPGVVVELGGGTGSITAALLDSGIDPTDIVVIEQEAALCEVLAERFPNTRVVHGDARRLRSLLRRAGIGPVKAVVSSLPLLSIPRRAQTSIMAQVFSVLPNDGVFVQFTYGPASPVASGLSKGLHISGTRANWVLDNVPPAAVWRYSRKAA